MAKAKAEKKPTKPKEERPDGKLVPDSMMVRATFIAPVLGTAPGDPDIYEKFIGSKSADKDKLKDEMASLPAEELIENGKTVFHRDEDGNPILLPYQIKGFIKEACKVFCEFGDIKLAYGRTISKWTVQRIVDNFIHIGPGDEVLLQMPDGSEVEECTRPLRAHTMKGERVSLACSEKVPKGTVIEFVVEWLNPALEKTIRDALDYGKKKGIGQWRNSGMGRFTWEEIA
jgi:hypothetical protein